MLQFQLVTAPFRLGIDEGTDPKQVPLGTLTRAENVVWQKTGRLQKRLGTSLLTNAIVGGGAITTGARLISRGEELALIDGTLLYSLTDAGWVNRGRVAEVGVEWTTFQESQVGVKCLDSVMLDNGNTVHAWVTGDPTDRGSLGETLRYEIVDSSTGSVVVPPRVVTRFANTGNCGAMRLISSGDNWVVVWIDSGNLQAYVGSDVLSNVELLQTDVRTTEDMGLDAISMGATEWVVGYAYAGGGIKLARYTWTSPPVLVISDFVTGEGATHIGSISLAGQDTNTLWCAYGAEAPANAVRYATADPITLVQVVPPTDIDTSVTVESSSVGLVQTSDTTCTVAWSYQGTAQAGGVLSTARIDDLGSLPVLDRQNFFCRLLSRPTLIGDRYYMLASTFNWATAFDPDTPIIGADVFVLDATYEEVGDGDPTTPSIQSPSRLVGKVETLGGGSWVAGFVASAVVISANEIQVPSPFQSKAAAAATGIRNGARLTKLTIGSSRPPDMWRPITYGQETYLSAGTEIAYDGVEAVGYGWPHGPYFDPPGCVAHATGGQINSGDYIYNVTAERRSAVGVFHRSPIGVAITKTVVGPVGSVTLAIVPVSLQYSIYNSGMYALYRTLVGGEVVQRLTIEPTYYAVFNDTFALVSQPVTKLDTSEDTQIGTSGVALGVRPFLYTQGGELEDMQPPGVLTHTLYRDRIFAIDGSSNALLFSKSFAEDPGTAGGFNPAFRIPVNDRLTGLAVLDERLIIFSRTGIYTLAGEGPAVNGDGSDYGSPNRLSTDVGCTNPRGIVSGPDGVFFVTGTETETEIHMLDRGLSVQWVGRPVQDLLSLYPIVTSAVLVSLRNHIRFSCLSSDRATGIVLVFDYTEKQWSHFVYGASLAIADALIHEQVYTFVTTNGRVYEEDDSTSLDNGQWVTSRLETAWIQAGGPVAYQAVRNFQIDGVSRSNHELSVYTGFNGDESYAQGPDQWLESIPGVTAPGLQRAKVSIGNLRKCASIRFKIEDAPPSSPGVGRGAAWSAMAIEVGMKKGPTRLAVGQTR